MFFFFFFSPYLENCFLFYGNTEKILKYYRTFLKWAYQKALGVEFRLLTIFEAKSKKHPICDMELLELVVEAL